MSPVDRPGAAPGSPAGREPAQSALEGSDIAGPAQVEAILQRIHDERAPLGGILAQAAWVEIAGGALLIAFDERNSFFREKVESRDTVEYVKKVAREVAGENLQVRVVSTATMTRPAGPATAAAYSGPVARPVDPFPATPNAGMAPAVAPTTGVASAAPGAGLQAAPSPTRPPRSAAIPEDRRRQLQDEALREPLVKSVLETFGAQIVDVDQI